jgi:ubiquinone/menaquinone biosynthesis C-methylase UbiE
MSKQPSWTGERLETFIQNESTIEHLHRYAIAMELAIGKCVLDIACGEGYGTALLAQKAKHATGMDINKSIIEKATEKYRKNNIRFEMATAEKIPVLDNSYDMVVSFETLEHVDDQETMLKEIKRVLKPAGILLLSTPEKKNYSDKTGYQNPFHKIELYRPELEEMLKPLFTQVKIYAQQIAHASIITGTNSSALERYSGKYEKIEKNIEVEPLYLLALAADSPLPALPTSLFTGNSIVENALFQREKMVTSTITYRLGHWLLYPFKLIRRLLKK